MSELELKLSVKCITTDDGEKYYLLCDNSCTRNGANRLPFPLRIYLTDTKVAFEGEIDEHNLTTMNPENLYSYNTEAIFGTQSNYCFSVEKLNENEVKLKWKRIQNRKRYQLGEIVLTLSDFDVIDYYWNYSSKTLKENEATIAQLKSTVDDTLKEFEIATAAIQELCEEKEKLECDLYTKFVAVLNGKKRKIRELEAKLEDLEKDDSKGVSNNKATSNVSSGSETEMELDKDEEEIVVPPKALGRRRRVDNSVNPAPSTSRTVTKIVPSKPSCSKTTIQFDSDSDDLMDDL